MCNHYTYKDNLNFCSKSDWHTDSHLFDSVHPTFHVIVVVVFCCDLTGSLGSKLEKSKSTIKK